MSTPALYLVFRGFRSIYCHGIPQIIIIVAYYSPKIKKPKKPKKPLVFLKKPNQKNHGLNHWFKPVGLNQSTLITDDHGFTFWSDVNITFKRLTLSIDASHTNSIALPIFCTFLLKTNTNTRYMIIFWWASLKICRENNDLIIPVNFRK